LDGVLEIAAFRWNPKFIRELRVGAGTGRKSKGHRGREVQKAHRGNQDSIGNEKRFWIDKA
jgi:hypothetical protein